MSYKIAEARKAKGWTQADFARKLETSQQQVARYESGAYDVKAGMIMRMSRVLGVTISYLLGLEDEEQDDDAKLEELCHTYRSLDDAGRDALLATARGLVQAFGKNKGGGAH